MTGIVPGFGTYESSLERDVMELLRFDRSVDRFVPQPLTLEHADAQGKMRKYTPDGLVYFKPDAAGTVPPLLYEVKYREDFRKDWKNLVAKFRCAKEYCFERNWRFQVFTEREVRTAYLGNVKFLWPYVEVQVPEQERHRMLTALAYLEEADPDLLLCALYFDLTNRARAIPLLWNLVATGAIGCDLTQPLSMRTRIWTECFE
jgi:hypothetical protein